MQRFDLVKNRIREAASLVQLIGDEVKLQRRSGYHSGRCPFHQEKTPSFAVYDDHYHCYGCGAHGDAITYVRETRGLGFVEALRYLGQKFGVSTADLEDSPEARARRDALTASREVLRAAQEQFVANLAADAGRDAREYLRQRGFTDSSIREFGFGLALDQHDVLVRSLMRQGHGRAAITASSVGVPSEKSGKVYDFFRGRLTIPIRDTTGALVSFGGRALGEASAKYLNGRESALFDKSRVLFGLHTARDAIRRHGLALVVEGYMDVLMLHQHGVGQAVACLGTAFRESHLALLGRFTKRVGLVFDGDQAGVAAVLRAVPAVIQNPQVDVEVVCMPAGEDPDSFVRQVGVEGFVSHCRQQAESLLDFALRHTLSGTSGLRVVPVLREQVFPWLRQVRDPLQQSALLTKLADFSGLSAQELNRELEASRDAASSPAAQAQARPAEAPLDVDEPLVLDATATELFGYLYWSQADWRTDWSELGTRLERDVELPPLASRWLGELISDLAAGVAPASREVDRWEVAQTSSGRLFLDELRRSADRFQHARAPAAVDLILDEQRRKQLRLQLRDLRVSLARESPESLATPEGRARLEEIQRISRELVVARTESAAG